MSIVAARTRQGVVDVLDELGEADVQHIEPYGEGSFFVTFAVVQPPGEDAQWITRDDERAEDLDRALGDPHDAAALAARPVGLSEH